MASSGSSRRSYCAAADQREDREIAGAEAVFVAGARDLGEDASGQPIAEGAAEPGRSGDRALAVGVEVDPLSNERGDEVGVGVEDARLREGDAEVVVVVVGVQRPAEPVDAGVEAQLLGTAHEVAVDPERRDADAVDRRERCADADRARAAVLDTDRHRQAPVRLDLLRLLEAEGTEDLQAREAALRRVDVVGVERRAFRQVGHVGDEARIRAPASGDTGRAIGRRAVGIDRDGRIQRTRRVVGDHLAIGFARLGVGKLPPALDRHGRGLVDHSGECRLAGAKSDRGGGLHLVVGIVVFRWRVHDPRDAEIESRPGPDVDHDRNRRPEVDVERQVGNLLPGGADAYDRAVVAGGIEGGEQSPVVAARLRDEAADPGGWGLPVGPERGGIADRPLDAVVRAEDIHRHGVGEGVDHLERVVFFLAFTPEVDPEERECVCRCSHQDGGSQQ